MIIINNIDGKIIQVEGQKCRYKLISGFNEIEDENEQDRNIQTIYVILTIEGANVFNTGLQLMNIPISENEVLSNIEKVKNWETRLFFITLTHHFYNDICGHSQSMSGLPAKISDQTHGMNTGFTNFGKKVLHKLLDNSNDSRILIDIKHMSVKSWNEYYEMLQSDYDSENIPLITSHGAVNGYRSHNDRQIDNQHTFGKFMDGEINFFDDELIRGFKSGGLFGIQLDEKRIASKRAIKETGKRISRRKMLFHRSKLVWNQIQHIAETLDKEGLFGWGIQSIGSDFDGLINPVNGFWGSEELGLLEIYFETHAHKYMESSASSGLNSFNRISPDNITDRFMHDNAYEFLRKNF